MAVSYISDSCCGFEEVGSIQIKYNIPSATQLTYHDNPGQHFSGKSCTAYLPNNETGKDLLKRLEYAFMHGLTFTVGTSVTSGKANQCTWASIHHKTSKFGGVQSHGYPDPDFFLNCNEELDSLFVPPASDLDFDGTEFASAYEDLLSSINNP